MAQKTAMGFRGFTDPLEIVDRTDLDYEDRLAMLQQWRAELERSGASEEELAELTGAIQALEMGAAVQGDESDEIPEGRGYGVHKDA